MVDKPTLEAAERRTYKPGVASGTPPLDQIELTADEYKSRGLGAFFTAGPLNPKTLQLARGFRVPYVRRLDPVKDKAIIDGVTAARGALKKIPIGSSAKVNENLRWVVTGEGEGWMYTPHPASDYFKWLAKAILGEITSAVDANNAGLVRARLATACIQGVEGTPSSCGCYDGRVFTQGYGHALGAHKPWYQATKLNDKIATAFAVCGLSIEYEPIVSGGQPAVIAAYQMVDLRDADSPKVLVWDNYFHGYGWLTTKGSTIAVRPRNPVSSLSELEDGKSADELEAALKFPGSSRKYDLNSHPAPQSDATNYQPAAFNILKCCTQKDQKDIEIIFAYIDIAEDPLTRDAVFHGNWDDKVRGCSLTPPMAPLTTSATAFVAMIKHEIGLTQEWLAGFDTKYLSPEDRAALPVLRAMVANAGTKYDNPDGFAVAGSAQMGVESKILTNPLSALDATMIHDAILCKAIVRACASLWEADRIAAAVARYRAKGKPSFEQPVDFNTDDLWTPKYQWRFHTVRRRWLAMSGGDGAKPGAIVADALDNIIKISGEPAPAALTALKDNGVQVTYFRDKSGALEFDLKNDVPAPPADHYVAWHQPPVPPAKRPPPKFYDIGPKSLIPLPPIIAKYGRALRLVGLELDGTKVSRIKWESGGTTVFSNAGGGALADS